MQKERDSMVVKYAHSEKEVIVAHNQRDSMEKKMKESLKERDVMMEKIKAMNNEKARVCNMLEVKVNKDHIHFNKNVPFIYFIDLLSIFL